MLERVVGTAPYFLIAAVRCFAMLMTLPLFSMRTISRSAKLALTFYMAYIILPHLQYELYSPYIGNNGAFSIDYILLIIGEGFIGIIIGFYINIIFTAFSTAGQFFAFQMGFSASEVYDSLSQVENPLMGQFFNLIVLLIFLNNHWAQKLFTNGLISSFETLNVFKLLLEAGRERLIVFMLSGLTKLFADAFIIALPIMGTLFLVTVTTGILSKAAPQMNLLSEGFPIMILFAFFIITSVLGVLCDFFIESFAQGFQRIQDLFSFYRGGVL